MAFPGPRRGVTTWGNSEDTSSLGPPTVTLPTHQTNDVLLCLVSALRVQNAIPVITTPSGWTVVRTDTWDDGVHGFVSTVYRRTATSGSETAPTFLFTVDGNPANPMTVRASGLIASYPNVDLTTPVESLAGTESTTAVNPISFPAVTSAGYDRIRIGLHGSADDRSTTSLDFIEGADFTNGTRGPSAWLGESQQQNRGHAAAKSATLSGLARYVSHHFYLRPASPSVPTSGPVQDVAANTAPSFSGITLTNNSSAGADTTPPVLTAASANGVTVSLIYNENLNTTAPATSAFVVKVNGSVRSVSSVSISTSIVQLILSTAVVHGDTITVDYTAPASNPIRDTAGNIASSFLNRSATNNTADTTPPTIVTRAVNGTLLTLGYSEPLDSTSVPATSAFAVVVAGVSRAVSAVSLSGSTVTLTLASAVTNGESVTVAYTAPGSNFIRDISGNPASSFTATAVVNNTPPAGSISAPTGLTATAVSSTRIDLQWNSVSGANGYRLMRSLVSGGPYADVVIQSGISYADTGLTPNTTYYYVVRARSA